MELFCRAQTTVKGKVFWKWYINDEEYIGTLFEVCPTEYLSDFSKKIFKFGKNVKFKDAIVEVYCKEVGIPVPETIPEYIFITVQDNKKDIGVPEELKHRVL